jgi:cell division septation protein DedD
MSDPGIQDPFHEPPARAPRQKLSPRTRLFAAVAASAVAVMVILVWAGYELGKSQTPGEPPLVKAPEGAEKVRPDDPGGMYFEHQDKTVYGAFDGREEEVEQLLPPAEEPMSKPEPVLPVPEGTDGEMADEAAGEADTAPAIAETVPKVPGAPADETRSETAVTQTPPAPPVTAPDEKTAAAIAPPPASVPKPQATTEKPVAKSDAKPPLPVPPAPAITAAPPAGSKYAVQLGAFRTEAAADAGWTLLSGKHRAQLGGLNHYVVPVDLGDKGRLYRLQAGPFATRADADDKCAELKKSAVDCLAVSR